MFMATITQQEWNTFFNELNEVEKKSVLEILKSFLQKKKKGFGSISIDEYNKEIDEALEEVANGEFITQAEMEKIASKW
jgi:hypothetical protein